MKSLIAPVVTALTLAGCVAVPYHPEPVPAPGPTVGYYYYSPYYYAPPPTIHFHYERRRYYRR
jgi:hypothetical protein